MGEGDEAEFVMAGVVAAGGGGGALATFDHVHDRFDLPTLAEVEDLGVLEEVLHGSADRAGGGLVAGAANGRWDESEDVALGESLVVGFAVVAGVEQAVARLDELGQVVEQRGKLVDIGVAKRGQTPFR